jgi:small subunit ribosomal protein S16
LVKLRLTRLGTKKKPFYRLVAADKDSPRDGRFIEILGHYSPRQNPQGSTLNEERVLHWLSRGAVPTGTALSLLRQGGILRRWHEMRHPSAEAPASEDAASEDAGEADSAEV